MNISGPLARWFTMFHHPKRMFFGSAWLICKRFLPQGCPSPLLVERIAFPVEKSIGISCPFMKPPWAMTFDLKLGCPLFSDKPKSCWLHPISLLSHLLLAKSQVTKKCPCPQCNGLSSLPSLYHF